FSHGPSWPGVVLLNLQKPLLLLLQSFKFIYDIVYSADIPILCILSDLLVILLSFSEVMIQLQVRFIVFEQIFSTFSIIIYSLSCHIHSLCDFTECIVFQIIKLYIGTLFFSQQ